MNDVIETIGSSIVQHGPVNERVYLMKLHPVESGEILSSLDRLAVSRGYSKIFAKVPARVAPRFVAAGYEPEAEIPGFYSCGAGACFLGKYFSVVRRQESRAWLVEEVLEAARRQEKVFRPALLPPGFTGHTAREGDVPAMAALYREVFATYPFPIHDPDFLRAAMHDSTVFFGVWKGEKLVALSSAEIDAVSGSAEMTDFATLPEYRGQSIALFLLQRMEDAVRSRGIGSLFTIARACSFGMNITFARNGYRYGGTLTNNTNIAGSLESMNVWYKVQSRAEHKINPAPE